MGAKLATKLAPHIVETKVMLDMSLKEQVHSAQCGIDGQLIGAVL